METGIILKNLAIVGVIVGVAFASQQPWLKTNSKEYIYGHQVAQPNQSAQKATDWFGNNVSSKVSGLGAQVSGGVSQIAPNITSVGQTIETQKNNAVENSTSTTKKIIAQKILDMLGVRVEELANCPAN